MCNPYSRDTLERILDAAERDLEKAKQYDWVDVNQAPFIMGNLEGQLGTVIRVTRQHLEDSDDG